MVALWLIQINLFGLPIMKAIPLPETGFVRLWQIIGCKRRGLVAHIPESSSSWWQGVKAGTRPPPIKLGGNTTVWRAEDIHRFIAEGQWNPETVEGAA